MEVQVARAALQSALRTLKRVVPPRSSIPAYTYTRMQANGELSLAATDGDLTAVCHVPCKTKRPGAVCAPVADLAKLVAKGEPTVTLRSSAKQEKKATMLTLDVASESATLSVPAIDAKEYPRLRTAMPASGVELPAKDLREMLQLVAHAMSDDETRQNLVGVFLEMQPAPAPKRTPRRKGIVTAAADHLHDLTLTGTDGHRLASVTRPVACAAAIANTIMPRRFVGELLAMLKVDTGNWPGIVGAVRLAVDQGWIHAVYADTMVSARVPEAEYPNYRQVVPDLANTSCMIAFSPRAMKQSLGIALAAHGRCKQTSSVTLDIKNGKLRLSAECPDGGKADTIAATSGTGDITVGFNGRYLLDLVSVLPSAGGFYFTDNTGPMLCRCPSEERFIGVVMPMRL